MFTPPFGATGARSAAIQVEHNWVGGTAAAALLGAAEASAANVPVGNSGGGGGALGLWLAGILALPMLARR